MFCVAICDDEEILCTQLENFLTSHVERGIINISIFYSCEKLYESMSRGMYYDLIFLDIEFSTMNGVEVGKNIRETLKNRKVQIVYISANQQYAMQLFAVRPMDFLIKPISAKDVIAHVEEAMEQAAIFNDCFTFKFGTEIFQIAYGDILYFESNNRKVRIHTKYEMKEMYTRLDRIEKEAPLNFLRIHKSYLVNRTYITSWKAQKIILEDKILLPISKGYRKKIKTFLLKSEGEEI